MSTPRQALLPMALLLAACGTTPTHYYTLVPASAKATPAGSAALIELPSVRVPVQLDQRSFVVRLSANEVAPVESRRWLAPLPDEIAAALRDDVQRRLSAASSTAQLRYRLVVDISRFDGWLGQRLDLAAEWTLIESRSDTPDTPGATRRWTCSTVVTQSLASGYPALVSGAQRAVDQLAAPMAALIQSASSSQATLSCP